MPKLKETDTQKRQKQLTGNIRCLLIRKGMKDEQIFKTAPFGRSTYYARMQHPDDFSISELVFIAKRLNVSIYELLHGIQ